MYSVPYIPLLNQRKNKTSAAESLISRNLEGFFGNCNQVVPTLINRYLIAKNNQMTGTVIFFLNIWVLNKVVLSLIKNITWYRKNDCFLNCENTRYCVFGYERAKSFRIGATRVCFSFDSLATIDIWLCVHFD